MRVTVLLFARPREVVGSGHLVLDVPEGATAGEAFDALARATPALGPMRTMLRCAVDGAYTDWTAELHEAAELALIPPTAGG